MERGTVGGFECYYHSCCDRCGHTRKDDEPLYQTNIFNRNSGENMYLCKDCTEALVNIVQKFLNEVKPAIVNITDKT